MSLVVDTDVASFLFKKDTRAALYAPHLSGHMLVISFQTLAELELWALSAGWGARRKRLLGQYLRRYLVHEGQSIKELEMKFASTMRAVDWATVRSSAWTQAAPKKGEVKAR